MAKTQVRKNRIYETFTLLDPIVTQEQQDGILAKVKRAVEDGGGTWLPENIRGKRKLSYPIKKKIEAIHAILYSEGPGGIPAEIAQVLKFDALVLRAQTVVVDKVPDAQAEAALAEASPSGPGPSDPAYQDDKDGEL